MSLDLVVRTAVSVVISFTMTYATCWLLSLFLWGWLAALLALAISIAASCTEAMQQTTERAGDVAVAGLGHAISAFRRLRGA